MKQRKIRVWTKNCLMKNCLPMYAVKCFYMLNMTLFQLDDDKKPSEQRKQDKDIYS